VQEIITWLKKDNVGALKRPWRRSGVHFYDADDKVSIIADEVLLLCDDGGTRMERYKNLSGNSGVAAYESGPDYIKIKFREGGVYLYNYSVTGRDNVERMKKVAEEGKGLSTFINKYVRDDYAAKL